MKKIVYVVLDGVGDLPNPSLGKKTPLEFAKTPNLDSLAKKSRMGSVYTVKKSIAPESDEAVLSILGYDVHEYYTGRGPVEAFGSGLAVGKNDVAIRANFATLEETGWNLVDRRVARSLTTPQAKLLEKEINKKVKLTSVAGSYFRFKATVAHRCVLVIGNKKHRLSDQITNTDPAYKRKGYLSLALTKFPMTVLKAKAIKKGDKAADLAAKLINEFVEKSTAVMRNAAINSKRKRQKNLPATVILCRGAGMLPPALPSFKEKFDMRMGCFVEMPVELGIAKMLSLGVIKVELDAGNPKKQYEAWAKKVLPSLKSNDGLYIHIKGPDIFGHDANARGKAKNVELIDKYFFGNILKKLDLQQVVIAVTADHSTPCTIGGHSDDPVPLLITGKSDGLGRFTEKNAKKGSLGVLQGTKIMPLLKRCSGS